MGTIKSLDEGAQLSRTFMKPLGSEGNRSRRLCSQPSMLCPVSVLGIGAVTGYGWGVDELWKGLQSGESACRPYTGLGDMFPDPCWISRIPEGGDGRYGMTRYARGYAAAALEAITDARARGWLPGPRVGIATATTRGDLELIRTRYVNFDNLDFRKAYVQQTWTTPALQVMREQRFFGPTVVTSAACSSGLHALALAQRLIAIGDASDMIVVAADVGWDGEELRLFNAVGPLHYDVASFDVCRPLHQESRGFVMGEGVAAVVLSPGVPRSGYLSVDGTRLGNDAHHAVGIEPSHRHIIDTVDRALVDANVSRNDVDLYIAHGTGTAECRCADESVLDHLGPRPTCYGTKPFLGHCIGAATLLDTVILARGVSEGTIPVCTIDSEAACHPQLAVGPSIPAPDVALQLGLGFGGNIAAGVYRRIIAPTARDTETFQ